MKNQHFNRTHQRVFAFKSKATGLFLREGGKVWTISIELAELFLGRDGKIAIETESDDRFSQVEELEPVEVIPKLNGTIKYNIQADKEAQR